MAIRRKGFWVMAQKQETKYRTADGQRKLAYRRFQEGEDYLPIAEDELITMLEFEKNNMQRAAKRKGRPPIFESVEQLQEQIIAYWDYLAKANREQVKLIPDTEGLCSFLGINRDTLHDWERNNYKGFSETIKTTKNAIAAFKKQLALQGKIPPIVFATDFNNNHGYTQKQEMIVTPNQPLGEAESNPQLAEKYVDLIEDGAEGV